MSAVLVAPQRMTADEFLRMYGDCYRVELIEGVVTHIAGMGMRNGFICANVAAEIGGFVKSNRLGRVASNDTFVRTTTNPDSVRGADLVFLSYATLPAEIPTPKSAATPPLELVAEVRLPTDSVEKVTAKAMEYLAAGVKVVLVIDPDDRFVAVFRANQLSRRFEHDQTLTLPDVLPGFAVPVANFFE